VKARNDKLNINALVTGRGGNTLANKNVLPVLGKPLVYYPAKAAAGSSLVHSLYVSSDSDLILNAVADLGYIPIRRPAELSKPTALHLDAVKHAVGVMDALHDRPDILVLLAANVATVQTAHIEQAIQAMVDDPTLDSAVAVVKDQDRHPYRAKRIHNGRLVPWFDFDGKFVSSNRQELPANYFLAHSFYVLNIASGVLDKSGQPPFTIMGKNSLPLDVGESIDVHSMHDITRTEQWLLLNDKDERRA